MHKEGEIKRSSEAYLGGVCAGLADHFDVDHIIVRILAVLITLVTLGFGAVVYVVLWVVLPRGATKTVTFDVEPELAESMSYGTIDARAGRSNQATAALGASHVPPDPPSRGQFVKPASNPFAPGAQGQVGRALASSRPDKTPIKVRIAIAGGMVLLFLFIALTVSPAVYGTSWWNFWPIGIIITGLAMIVFPFSGEHSPAWHTAGVIVAFVGALLLPISIGVYALETIPVAIVDYWGVLAVALMLYIIGAVRDSAPMLMAGALVFAMFCLLAISFCGVPGPLSQVIITMPTGRTLALVSPRDFGFPF